MAAKNWKSLLNVTQFELTHCIYECIIKGKTSSLKVNSMALQDLYNEAFIFANKSCTLRLLL